MCCSFCRCPLAQPEKVRQTTLSYRYRRNCSAVYIGIQLAAVRLRITNIINKIEIGGLYKLYRPLFYIYMKKKKNFQGEDVKINFTEKRPRMSEALLLDEDKK